GIAKARIAVKFRKRRGRTNMRFGRSYWKCYLLFIRPKQQLGLSTPLGWRLATLKMTDNYDLREQSATPSAATFEDWQRGVTTLDPPHSLSRCVRAALSHRLQDAHPGFEQSGVLWHLAVGRQFAHQCGQQLREHISRRFGRHAGFRGQLFHLVAPQDVLNLIRADGNILSGSNP